MNITNNLFNDPVRVQASGNLKTFVSKNSASVSVIDEILKYPDPWLDELCHLNHVLFIETRGLLKHSKTLETLMIKNNVVVELILTPENIDINSTPRALLVCRESHLDKIKNVVLSMTTDIDVQFLIFE